MIEKILSRLDWPRSLLISALIGAGLFFCFGRWTYEALGRYGFELFADSTFTQDVALVLALAIASPATFIVEYDPISRAWFALNGALWGSVVYLAWRGLQRLTLRRRKR